jgi:hypothetical protein
MPAPDLFPEEQRVEQFLQGLGLAVHRIALSSSKTPDFRVDGDARGYLFELKTRRDSEEWLDSLNEGEVAYQERSTCQDRWAQDGADQALRQFRSEDAQHLRWWVLWLAIRCRAAMEAMSDQAFGSLFGIRQVVYEDPQSKAPLMRDCLFATPGVFERHPEIVACVVDRGDRKCLCVNDEFARDFESFRQSVLWTHFAREHPPTSASDLVANRGFFRVDHSIDRKDESAVIAHLELAYGLDGAILIDMKAHSASKLIRP